MYSLRRSSTFTAGVLAGAAVLLAGCSAGDAPPPTGQVGEPIVVTPGPPPPPGATGAPVVGISTLPPVPVGADAPFGGGLIAKVVTIEPLEIKAQGPGEIAGPGAAVTVELNNDSDAPIDLGGVAVNAYSGDGVPASGSDTAPAAAVKGALEPGASKQGVYVFQVPPSGQASLTVEINYSGSPNVVLVRR